MPKNSWEPNKPKGKKIFPNKIVSNFSGLLKTIPLQSPQYLPIISSHEGIKNLKRANFFPIFKSKLSKNLLKTWIAYNISNCVETSLRGICSVYRAINIEGTPKHHNSFLIKDIP